MSSTRRKAATRRGKTGTYFGLWALATKLATAIGAAGSLPVAELLGFNPASGHYGTTALIIVYIVLPVLIKIVAALLIWFIRIEAERGSVRDEMRGRAHCRLASPLLGFPGRMIAQREACMRLDLAQAEARAARPSSPAPSWRRRLRKSTVCLRSPSCRSPSDG